MKNLKIANELVKIARSLVSFNEKHSKKAITSAKSNDPSDFENFKKHIVDFCKEETKKLQELNYFCQENYNALNQNIDVFSDIQQIGQMVQKMLNKAKNARRIK